MNPLKQLAGQTAIYGLGTVVPRFLNYGLLTFFYTRIFELGEYGVVTELYAYVVVLLVILTYGMETGYFRFSEKTGRKEIVYSTALISLLFTSSLFIGVSIIFRQPLADAIQYSSNSEYIAWFGVIVGIDAFTAIPFAKLRRENKGLKFGMLKLINVGVIIILVLFFLLFAPAIMKKHPQSMVRFIYNENIGVGYVFIANMAGSIITLLLLVNEIIPIKWTLDKQLLRKMLRYSFPLLVAGLAGTINEALDKIILKHLLPDQETAMDQLGIYGASFKIAVIMGLFIQMFRYAAEPFFFAHAKKNNAKELYADVMKYFIIAGLMIFLGIMMFIDLFKYIIGPGFRVGIDIVPIVLMGYLFYGIFMNLSIWYKLNDLTKFGAVLAFTGAIVTISINLIFVPEFGYNASAWGHFFCYFTMLVCSYFMGRRHYKIKYDLKSIAFYFIVAGMLYFCETWIKLESKILDLGINLLLFGIFVLIIVVKEDLKTIFIRKK